MNTIEQEKILLEGLAKEDKLSIERIYREHFTMVQALVLNNSGSSDDAADIFQETMIVLFEKARSGKFELQCQLKTYIYAVSRRLWLKKLPQLRRNSMQVENLEDSITADEDLVIHEKIQNDFNIMENALGQIGEPCKSLLEAYYIHRRHMHQIATDFGYTNADNAKTQKYKCLLRLKKLFFAQYKNEE